MLDGGVCDSIPVCRAREDGFLNNVVILTKPKEYRKPNKKFYLPKFLLHKYPKLRHQTDAVCFFQYLFFQFLPTKN